MKQGRALLAPEHAEKLWNGFSSYDYSDSWSNIIFYLVFQACGDPRAGQVLEEARGALLEQASKISDEGMRQSFLQNIPENKEILNLR